MRLLSQRTGEARSTPRQGRARGSEVPPEETSGPVLIDVDDGHGALVITAGPGQSGSEIEIEAVGEPRLRTHVWVLPRSCGSGITYAAVFPSLRAGLYRVLDPGNETATEVLVEPGRATTFDARGWDAGEDACPG